MTKPVEIWYRNYRGEVAFRRITPKGIVFGSTEWHPEDQWLLHAFDEDKQAYRYFAIKDFVSSPQPASVAQAWKEPISQDAATIAQTAHVIINKLTEENERLRAAQRSSLPTQALLDFFKWAMREGPWDGGDLDGGSVQDKAEALGLIVKTQYDAERHGVQSEFEDGDDWFEYAPSLVPSTEKKTGDRYLVDDPWCRPPVTSTPREAPDAS